MHLYIVFAESDNLPPGTLAMSRGMLDCHNRRSECYRQLVGRGRGLRGVPCTAQDSSPATQNRLVQNTRYAQIEKLM